MPGTVLVLSKVVHDTDEEVNGLKGRFGPKVT